MAVRIETCGPVWTVIHSRPQSRNAMDPDSAKALFDAFVEFDSDKNARVAVFWGEGGAFCSGWDLKHAAQLKDSDPLAELSFPDDDNEHSIAPMGPSRLELDKPVIAAIAGPAVAGGMELALWCDIRVMERSAYMGVYCRRWGIPLIDGGTVRLPRLIGQGRALDLILTGRKVDADECLQIGLCEYTAADGEARSRAEELAHEIARFPQDCLRADRRSALQQFGLPVRAGLHNEWRNSRPVLASEGVAGATRFAAGKGRGGDFSDV